ncbi:hypothetical protein COO60DRAFT_581296 [Scenedesmus sp. NREL 46B-D3]|nr:hypothetical protein COO60DRAFT_581296 [Scenedesmus sp. NREL 46B-D3]
MQERKEYSLMGHADFSYHQSLLGTSSRLAWLYVGVLCTSYVLCLMILHSFAPVDVGMWQAFLDKVPLDVFKWQLAAFGGVLLLNIINLVFCSNPVQYNCNVLLVLIHSVAFVTDWLIEAQGTSLVLGHNGRFFVPLRYVQWMHTTPTMILLMSMMSDMSPWRVTAAVGGDLVMVLAGLGASWTSGVLQVLLLLVSFAGFAVVVRAIMDMFLSAMAESTTDGTSRQLLGRMLALTLVVWSLFPLVWLLGQAGLVSLTMEQVLWGAADYGAKVVFSSHLWQKNLSTVQQRREAAQELMGALDRGLLLERVRGLLASKERLVYALSHELRSPITGMLALVQELLHNKTQSAASRTRMLHMIRSSATCLLNAIDTTLSHNGDGSAAGQHLRKTHKVNLWRVSEAVLRLTRPMVKDNVRLINCISREMPPVKGDSTRLMQVLLNLVCTCLRFTHVGDVRVSASQTQSAASVVVADTGQGIPAEQLAQALDPFQQAGEGADVWDVCRSGLGLYLVQQALINMGSSINASSEPGRGSNFRFELPLADSECESESELETDMFSEAGSLRASLELADYDGAAARAAAAPRSLFAPDTTQFGGAKHLSADLLSTPAATPGGPRMASYGGSSEQRHCRRFQGEAAAECHGRGW